MPVITAVSTSASPPSAAGLLLVTALGAAGHVIGARWTFNLGGAVDTLLARRKAGLELRAQRSGNLGAIDTDGVGYGFYRAAGILLIVSGVALLAVSLLFIMAL
ncbi:hypothetical protein ACFRU3_48730 [Streptomyces sp. NPDC056910]|uniref:hypothetical protein n=1 Tax=Streptomyces sp. NPDC056910 TaxID=3345964 RepID=UPI0036AA5CC1